MALYEVTLRQSYYDQLCVNTFSYYVPPSIGVTPSALELLTLLGFIPSGSPLAFPNDTLADAIWTFQSSAVLFLSAEARELYSLTDFYEAAYSPAIDGNLDTGDDMSPFVAYGFYSARVRTDIRRGFKRFVGVTEGVIDNGGVIGSGLVANLTDCADKMSEVLGGATATYEPCVISREKVVDPDTGKVTYQLYADEAEQEEHVASPLEWTYYTTVRSQTSRQYGRGN